MSNHGQSSNGGVFDRAHKMSCVSPASGRERVKGLVICDAPERLEKSWPPDRLARLAPYVDFPGPEIASLDWTKCEQWWSDVEVIFSTWGMPSLTADQLALMPGLKAVFYVGGSVKHFAKPFLDRNIQVFSASQSNAIPVAEFALSQILFSLKLGWFHVRQFLSAPGPGGWNRLCGPGCYLSTVGIVSMGATGRKLCELLQSFALTKMAFDPYADDAVFSKCHATRVSLKRLFAESDVVSLHTPWLKETEGIVNGELISSMKPYATLINTARGAIINEAEAIEVLRRRGDLTAVLDVTHPEPPVQDSPLYSLPNVILLPHIAGSLGNEVLRMTDCLIEEFIAWRNGSPLRHSVTKELLERSA